MSAEPEPPSWAALLTLMVHGPDQEPSIRGAVRSSDDEREYFWSATDDEPLPVFAGAGSGDARRPLRVWRDGRRVRVEEADGTVSLIADDETVWHFESGDDVPRTFPGHVLRFGFRGTELLVRRTAEDFAGDDFTRPTGPPGATTFLGRPCWTVELAPPPRKPHPMQLVVDAETGVVLQQRNDGFGTVDEWVEFVVGEVLDPALFSWTGPVRTSADRQAQHRAEVLAERDRRLEWFTANVAASPLRVELDLTPFVHSHDEVTGAFQASLGEGHVGALARRPRSAEPWEDLHWSGTVHRWSTPRWDWALAFYEDQPAPGAVEALRRQLGDG